MIDPKGTPWWKVLLAGAAVVGTSVATGAVMMVALAGKPAFLEAYLPAEEKAASQAELCETRRSEDVLSPWMEKHGQTCAVLKKNPVWAEKCVQKEGTFFKQLYCAQSCEYLHDKNYSDILKDLCDLTGEEDGGGMTVDGEGETLSANNARIGIRVRCEEDGLGTVLGWKYNGERTGDTSHAGDSSDDYARVHFDYDSCGSDGGCNIFPMSRCTIVGTPPPLLIPVELDGSSGGTNGAEKALDGDIATAWFARPGAREKVGIWVTATVPHELAAVEIYGDGDVWTPRFVEVEAEALGGGGFVRIASAELGRVRGWQRVAVPEGTAVAAAAWRVNINSTFGRIDKDFPDVFEIRFVDRRLSTKPEEVA